MSDTSLAEIEERNDNPLNALSKIDTKIIFLFGALIIISIFVYGYFSELKNTHWYALGFGALMFIILILKGTTEHDLITIDQAKAIVEKYMVKDMKNPYSGLPQGNYATTYMGEPKKRIVENSIEYWWALKFTIVNNKGIRKDYYCRVDAKTGNFLGYEIVPEGIRGNERMTGLRSFEI